MKEVLTTQYELARDARSVLLNYVTSMSYDNFTRSHPEVGNGGSIRNLLVHINNSYHGWIMKFAFREPFEKRVYTDLLTVKNCEEYFEQTDNLVKRFINHFDSRYYEPLEGQLASRDFTVTPLQIFMHVVTHEFHHKGQILVLGRMWGYEPVDTDVLR
jgi:uncharacterized damage-inducible protein DinB